MKPLRHAAQQLDKYLELQGQASTTTYPPVDVEFRDKNRSTCCDVKECRRRFLLRCSSVRYLIFDAHLNVPPPPAPAPQSAESRLIPLGVAGLVTALTVYISGNEEHVITLIFAPIVVFWAIGENGQEARSKSSREHEREGEGHLST